MPDIHIIRKQDQNLIIARGKFSVEKAIYVRHFRTTEVDYKLSAAIAPKAKKNFTPSNLWKVVLPSNVI